MLNSQITFKPSQRAVSLQLSEIAQISEAAARLLAQGKPVLSFGTGEPDFPTPAHVVEAAHQAALDGKTTYPATKGVAELRGAIAAQAGFECGPEQVIVSTGAKQVLFNAFQASSNPGDEVIVPAPYWTSYKDIIEYSQAKMVTVPCAAESDFLLTPEQLESAITDKTRWLLLNTPGNPSGGMYSEAHLAALSEVLRKYPHVWVISDEIYQHITYQPFASFAVVSPDLSNRTLIVNGVSKAHAMTGWRIGWGIGPAELIRTMVAIQGQATSGACSIAQAAALAALVGPQDHLASRNIEFRRRRDYVVKALTDIPGLDCRTPQGAFYVFPKCEGIIGKRRPDGGVITDDAAFCAYLLSSANLALVPGRAFGLPGHFRLSYAYSMTDLEAGLSRIARAVESLSD